MSTLRLAALSLLVAASAALAQPRGGTPAVAFSGSMGDKAILVVNGTPRTVAVGGAYQSIRLVAVNATEATVEIDGKRAVLALGGAPVSVSGGGGASGGTTIVLTAGPGGHFVTGGSINGRSTQFVVDTGATLVSLSQSEADRLGVNYRQGERGMVQTANGSVAAFRTTLDVVRIGDVQVHNVEAVVVPAPMSTVLLGNSFLTRFQMKRENDRMTLERRF